MAWRTIPIAFRSGHLPAARVIVVALLAVSIFFFALPAHAQSSLPGTGGTILLTYSPVSPSPGDTVRLSVRGTSDGVSDSDIVWQVNGKTVAQGKGVDSTPVKVGALGTETQISVTATASDGTTTSAQAVIIPTELDLLVDSDSYVPPFYRGRPRASVGTNLHVQALPVFRRAGKQVSASSLIYTWRRNDVILGSISGMGRSEATIPVEHLYGIDTISVEARSADGALSHTSSVSFSAYEPVLALYEDHPLNGVLYHRALGASAFVPGTEMTFAAVPFFAPVTTLHDPALDFAWHVNTAAVVTNSATPDKITINAENSSGIALIQLEVTHATNYSLEAKGGWNVTFSSGGGVADQFRSGNQ
ncbi:hypothetical protein A3D71_03290 [Candidatus Kaiserbacteria bacterium RIFCSPHIGHO2_02_FULL_55_20]|uniref:Uncharacterized protein n=1 Tax=Candidatus Kaiserbacteria bacterium RIFCSPHIGHO2_02_FULL_55_20 TaxID=1798497 RepID=A0A1F6DXI9_9BACT|nr:MAG: hypothetical protein A2680_02295 [Candidatus Kaiserbacteria bacterium RIFCSPHIGHO2_01_FULL_55_37]OGG66057.1 MAG: hypothetical protein A3D71_03290 [Candidatus Kaiserbacteria bacterium RIFCSPHIGHO2_02_FULL_55_20]